VIVAIGVGLAAGLGAVARYVLDHLVQHRHESSLPWGTLVVNVSGSLLLGVVTGLASRGALGGQPAAVLSAGFCSGYTTWSTFMYESLALAEDGSRAAAGLNVLASMTLGLGAAATGLALAAL
jgi:CrcB protein